ncbi:MAG: efflux RND transporter permease subunit, partial [Chitinivibrionales bacterium]
MDITELSIKRPLVIIMVILAMVLFGAVMFSRFAVDIMPEMDLPYVTVQSVYPGAGPEEIENNVAEPIEEEMVTISGLKNLSSYCMESVCFTILEFEGDVDADLASIDVKDKIDGILNDLPDDLEKPVISKFNPNEEPIVYLALTGDAPLREVREVAENDVKDALSKLQGVAKVDITGGRQREVVIDLEKEKLDAHGLSVIQVLPILKAASSSLPAGHIKGVDQEYTVKLAGKFKSIQEIRDLRLPVTKQGRAPVSYTVKLSEIAEVKDGFKEVRKKGRFRGKEAVLIEVTKRPDANTVGVAQSIIAGVDDIQESLSAGYELSVSQDDSDFIRNAVNDTYLNLILGIVLTSLILLLFLHDWKLMIIVAVTMPVSIVIALIPMKMMGFTLNIVTLMALTIAIGVLVTNSIVVLENIVRHTKKGDRPYDAAISGTKEIMLAVFASTLTNLAVFIPIATTQGITS